MQKQENTLKDKLYWCQLCGSREEKELGVTYNSADPTKDLVICGECASDFRRLRKIIRKWGIKRFLIHAGAVAGTLVEEEID